MLAARDICKSYGKGTARFDALAGVSLSVYSGESIAIVGKSGSGKSSLMHLLALMGGGRINTLFNVEAVFIGFLGSVIGARGAMSVRAVANVMLAETVIAELGGSKSSSSHPSPCSQSCSW